ncbi:MAG: biotin transporter BioY [Clostridia bacterium]
MQLNRKRTFDLATCALFVALMIVGAFLKIPTPVVPITFQLTFCLLGGMLLGAKLGAFSMAIYMLMGLIGIPVFSTGGGIGYLVSPTFGYIIGFIFSAFACGVIANPRKGAKFWRLVVGALVGFVISYAIGMFYYYLITTFYLHTPKDSWFIFQTFFLATAPKDIILALLACALAWKLIPILNKTRNLPTSSKSKDKDACDTTIADNKKDNCDLSK